MKHLITSAFAAFALVTLSTAGFAQELPSEDDLTRAYELNEQGFDAFEDARFADAARAFAEAWTFSRDETLRKNEALAWFRAGECEPAVDAANKFLLIEDINEADRTDIHSVLANCKVDFARRAIEADDLDLAQQMLDEAEALQADSVATDRIAGARVDLAAARRARQELEAKRQREAAETERQREVTAAPVVQPDPPILGYSLMGGGGAIVLGTLAYHLVAYGWQQRFHRMSRGEETGDQATFDSLRDRVHTARVLVPILYAVGVATAGSGVVLTFVLHETPTTQGSTSTPMIGIAGEF